jgi:PAT family beta-lactamase induction signal transducer AmpG
LNTWRKSLAKYFQKKLLCVLFLGFASGLPYGMLMDPLSFWLSESNIQRSAIGLISLVTLTYSFKAVWAPFIDRLKLPILTQWLGQRRSWIVLSQFLTAISLLGLGLSDPTESLRWLIIFAIAVGFSSATQDICIDAMRIELLEESDQGHGAAMWMGGWRIAFLASGVVPFFIASSLNWSSAYIAVSVFILLLIAPTIYFIPEPKYFARNQKNILETPKAWFQEAYIGPFKDLASRHRDHIVLMILLIITYRFSDMILGPMAMPFYNEIGFSKEEVALVTNTFGGAVTIMGGILGGVILFRYGNLTGLLLGAILVSSTNLAFALLTLTGANLTMLAAVIACDNLAQGLALAAFVAHLSSLTSEKFTASQYALLFLVATVPAKLIAGTSGFVVDGTGYFNFFLYAAGMGIPAILLTLFFYLQERTESRRTIL